MAGDQIATMGNRGNSTGPHLHWHMINPSGTRINPLVYLGGGGGTGLPKTTIDSIPSERR